MAMGSSCGISRMRAHTRQRSLSASTAEKAYVKVRDASFETFRDALKTQQMGVKNEMVFRDLRLTLML